jgi:hypothetical protein
MEREDRGIAAFACEKCGAAAGVRCKAGISCSPRRERDLADAHEEARLEDERRRGRPEFYVACPKCYAAEGAWCRDYRGKKKPTCNERLRAHDAVSARERYVAAARAVQVANPARERPRAEIQAQLDAEAATVIACQEADAWVATAGARVPRWLRDVTGCTTVAQVVEKWGEGARFNRAMWERSPAPPEPEEPVGMLVDDSAGALEELHLEVEEAPAPRRDPTWSGSQLAFGWERSAR